MIQLGATSVNLVAGEKPADVYSGIAARYVVKDAKACFQLLLHTCVNDFIVSQKTLSIKYWFQKSESYIWFSSMLLRLEVATLEICGACDGKTFFQLHLYGAKFAPPGLRIQV